MSELLVKDRQLVTPGDVLATGLDYLPGNGCYREKDEIKSKLLGLVKLKERYISIIPLAGVYSPRQGDGIIGVITDLQPNMWIVDINSPYDAILLISEASNDFIDTRRRDLSSYYDIGDIIYAKILSVTKSKHIALTMKDRKTKKLISGKIMTITPSKVPRLIGKMGSMIELIKTKTNCQIVVGQNGVVWIKGEKESLASKAIKLIESEAHIEGLTDKVTKLLEGDLNE
ncbi:MAG: S1 RNA-binding domain-containing protein [Candidatus Aenigmarchaeota archaeon]|nr:S1 RNA-binding domain-containing protein [Candidatus Aenigmarchaeota archaeon]